MADGIWRRGRGTSADHPRDLSDGGRDLALGAGDLVAEFGLGQTQ